MILDPSLPWEDVVLLQYAGMQDVCAVFYIFTVQEYHTHNGEAEIRPFDQWAV